MLQVSGVQAKGRAILAVFALLFLAGSAAAYPGIEHALLAMKSFSAWQDFDPAFYHALTDPVTPGSQQALDQYLTIKFYLIGSIVPDLLTDEGSMGSRVLIESLYAKRAVFDGGPLEVTEDTRNQVDAANGFVWESQGEIPNNNLPALYKMALQVRGTCSRVRDRAMVYGAYLHVVQDLHAGCFQFPSLWGTGRQAEPAVALDRRILENAESHDNIFELTSGVTPSDWERVTYYLFGRSVGVPPNCQLQHTTLEFYLEIPQAHVYHGWQEQDFDEVQTFVNAANMYFSVTNLTRERLEAYLHGYAISWFLLVGYPNQDFNDAGGVYAHASWSPARITDYVLDIGFDNLGFWQKIGALIEDAWDGIFGGTSTLDMARNTVIGLDLTESWPLYFEQSAYTLEWTNAVREKYGENLPDWLNDYMERLRLYVYSWSNGLPPIAWTRS